MRITTPHILVEVDNFVGNKPNLRALLKNYITKFAREISLESVNIVQNNAFINFGLTDTAIIDISKDSYLVITDDRPLYGFLINKGIDAVNLDDLRVANQ